MELDPLTVVAVVGMASLLIERVFYYRSKYKKKPIKPPPPVDPDNPTHGERIASLETEVELGRESNEKDHELIRKDIRKIFNLINGMKK